MAPMTAHLSGGLRLTVLGNASAAPHLDSPAAGFLVEWDTTRVLLDVGQGVVRALQDIMDPHDLTAIVIGHMHADHLPGPGRASLPVPMGRAGRASAAGQSAARRVWSARRPGDGDLGTRSVL